MSTRCVKDVSYCALAVFKSPRKEIEFMYARDYVSKNLLKLAVTIALAALLPVLSYASDPASANWTKLSPATSPTARFGHAMAYDPVSKKIVVFGGIGNTYRNDTWTFDGTAWTKEHPPVAPPVRTGAAMLFDRKTKKVVMFGGYNGGHTNASFLRDTWLWDGATSTWTEVKMNTMPAHATGAVLFHDPLTGGVMMFGGWNATQRVPNLHETYRWTGQEWQKLHPKTVPIGRGWAVAVLDPIRKNVVMTGGSGDTIRTDNTYTWDGKDWTQQFPTTQVDALVFAGIVFDPTLKAVVVFGGWDEELGQDINQTWSWDGSNWVQLTTKKSPPAREGLGMAYDPATHEAVMFGGQFVGSGHEFRDTWRWDGN
jgi:N-acetylneuraminic acid mutarotase